MAKPKSNNNSVNKKKGTPSNDDVQVEDVTGIKSPTQAPAVLATKDLIIPSDSAVATVLKDVSSTPDLLGDTQVANAANAAVNIIHAAASTTASTTASSEKMTTKTVITETVETISSATSATTISAPAPVSQALAPSRQPSRLAHRKPTSVPAWTQSTAVVESKSFREGSKRLNEVLNRIRGRGFVDVLECAREWLVKEWESIMIRLEGEYKMLAELENHPFSLPSWSLHEKESFYMHTSEIPSKLMPYTEPLRATLEILLKTDGYNVKTSWEEKARGFWLEFSFAEATGKQA